MQGSSRTSPRTETRFVGHAHFVVVLMRSARMPAIVRPKPSAKHLDCWFSKGGRVRGRLGMRDVQSGYKE